MCERTTGGHPTEAVRTDTGALTIHGKPIVVGVDRSPEAWNAAALAWEIAKAADAKLHLVHAAQDVQPSPMAGGTFVDASSVRNAVLAAERVATTAALAETLPRRLTEGLRVEIGRAAAVLPLVVGELVRD